MQQHSSSGRDRLPDFAPEHIAPLAAAEQPVFLHCQRDNVNELVAAAIHDFSHRNNKLFFSVDCRSRLIHLYGQQFPQPVRRELDEVLGLASAGMADWLKGGTILLTNCAELIPAEQVLLIDRLTQTLGCRVVCDMFKSKTRPVAGSLDTCQAEGITFVVPALRNNFRNIQFFSNYFLAKANVEWSRNITGISVEAAARLQAYVWAGDLDELRDAIYQSVIIAKDDEELSVLTLPPLVRDFRDDANSLRKAILTAEHKLIQQALEQCRNNKKKAAAVLNISRKTLYSKLRLFEQFAA